MTAAMVTVLGIPPEAWSAAWAFSDGWRWYVRGLPSPKGPGARGEGWRAARAAEEVSGVPATIAEAWPVAVDYVAGRLDELTKPDPVRCWRWLCWTDAGLQLEVSATNATEAAGAAGPLLLGERPGVVTVVPRGAGSHVSYWWAPDHDPQPVTRSR